MHRGSISFIFHAAFSKNFAKQECIPVGCVLPAQWPAVSRGGQGVVHTTHAPLCHACPPFHHAHPLATHVPPLPCMPPFTTHAPLHHACPPFTTHAHPSPCMPPLCHACPLPITHAPLPTTHAPPATMHAPPVNRMTNWCKNITLPQTLFAGGNNRFLPQTWGVAIPVPIWEILDPPLLTTNAWNSFGMWSKILRPLVVEFVKYLL